VWQELADEAGKLGLLPLLQLCHQPLFPGHSLQQAPSTNVRKMKLDVVVVGGGVCALVEMERLR
jgi:hypothetical protein